MVFCMEEICDKDMAYENGWPLLYNGTESDENGEENIGGTLHI